VKTPAIWHHSGSYRKLLESRTLKILGIGHEVGPGSMTMSPYVAVGRSASVPLPGVGGV
jgi:hypothetical protein